MCEFHMYLRFVSGATRRQRTSRVPYLLGPAFVAAVAYVDPGNVAANLTAGSEFGYTLVWVLFIANSMAVLVQYLSAKLGAVTGAGLPHLLGASMRPVPRRAYWLQAEVVAVATDLAEIIGGAIALHILFGLPLPVGGVIVTAISMALLMMHSRDAKRRFEIVIMCLLAVITIGFVAGLTVIPVPWGEVAQGLVPRFEGVRSLLLAASMLGATVMPHAIYVHSSLVRDRHGAALAIGSGADSVSVDDVLRATRWDVVGSMALAGTVNIAMLVLAGTALQGVGGTDTIQGAQEAISSALGPVIGVLFAVGLLASGLASTSVGSYAGAEIMDGLLHIRVPLMWRRAVTAIPALVVLCLGVDATLVLVISQVVLSFGIPFALIPLVVLTSRRSLMGRFANHRVTTLLAIIVAALIIALNVALIVMTVLSAGGGS